MIDNRTLLADLRAAARRSLRARNQLERAIAQARQAAENVAVAVVEVDQVMTELIRLEALLAGEAQR